MAKFSHSCALANPPSATVLVWSSWNWQVKPGLCWRKISEAPFMVDTKKRLIARKQARKLLMLTLSSSFWLVPISYTLHSCWLHIHVFKYIYISWFIIRLRLTLPSLQTLPNRGLEGYQTPAQPPTRVKCLCTGIPQRLQCITLAVPWAIFSVPEFVSSKTAGWVIPYKKQKTNWENHEKKPGKIWENP